MRHDVQRHDTPLLEIEYVWDRMFDIETTEERRALQSGASALVAQAYYQTARGRGPFGGRCKDGGGGRVGGRDNGDTNEN